MIKLIQLKKFSLLMATLMGYSIALANPVVDNVAAGNVSIQQTPTVTTVNQASQNAIINWSSFNIGANEATHFIQPAGGVALNRISPLQGASQIFGTLTATGKIILINPAGVYFGPNSFVNVGSLIATTANLTDDNFLKGVYQFDAVSGFNGSIVNAGTIQAAQHGLVALVGSNVTNDGKIQANLGQVVLAGGDAFTMSFAGNDLIHFVVDKAAANPKVTNNGSLIADGGKILVTAKAASAVLDNIINMNGIAQANSVYSQNGEIILSGDGAGVHIKAKLVASGKNSGEKGGSIIITGHDILVDSGSIIDTSGDLGGGKIIIGKDSFGELAASTRIQSEVSLLANAISGGNGGFIETSADHLTLGENLLVNTNAPQNKAGTWLIDPTDLVISNASTSNVSGTNNLLADNNANTSFLNITTLLNQLNTSNVIVQTTSGGSGAGSGNITVANNITWSSPYSLTLSAFNNILINNGVTLTATNALANLTLLANNAGAFDSASGNGRVLVNGALNVLGNVDIYTNATGFVNPVYSNITAALTNLYLYINNASEFQAANDGTHLNQNFALSQSIDLNGAAINPFGDAATPFSGLFDGLGHQIKNINVSGTDNVGLFGVNTGTISNLGVSGTVNGANQVGLLVGDNQGSIQNAFSYGLVNGTGTNVGGLVGLNSGTLTDTQSYAAVNGDTHVGGLAGLNSGTISNALSIGNVVGNTNVGGLVGNNSNLINNSFFDTDASGLSVAIGNDTGTASVTGGCFGTTCTNGGTVDLTAASTFSNAGWDMDNTWGIIEGTSYPYLKVAFPNGPRIISGQIGHFASYFDNPNWAPMNQSEKNPDYASFTADNIAQQQVTLAANGAVVNNNVYSGANGKYYSLNDNIADGAALIAYLTGSSNKANTITVAPTSNSSLTNFNLALNTVLVTDNGQLTQAGTAENFSNYDNWLNTNYFYTSINQTDVVDALGSLNDPGILFSTSGNDIILNPQTNYVLAPTTFYNLNGNITADQGSISSYGVIGISPLPAGYNGLVTLQTLNSGNIYVNDLLWETVSTGNYPAMVKLDAANNIHLHGIISSTVNDTLFPDTVFAFERNRGLTLSAAYTNQSITTGGNDSSHINMSTLNILKGKWYQNNVPSLFTYYPDQSEAYYYPYMFLRNLVLNNGVLPAAQVEFLRVGGGDGTIGNPYVIYDPYGLQGIASSPSLLNAHYRLGGDDPYQLGTGPSTFNAWDTTLWNNSKGFIPIGTVANPFNGTFDGNNGDPLNSGIWFVRVNDASLENVGIFGVTGPSAVISNLMLFENAIAGGNNVGALVGTNNGLIENAEVYQSFIIGNDNVGTLVGINNGTIRNSGTYGNRTFGNSQVGGLAGQNDGLIEQSYAANVVVGSAATGGLAGINNGTIRDSFWDTGATGQTLAASNGGTLDHVTGGCLLGNNCAFGGAANLSDPKTYLNLADGGYGLVTTSWDFINTWSIAEGASYPYHQVIFNPSGGAPTIFSGFSNAANQVIAMIWGEVSIFTSIQGNPFTGQVTTGSDGSFYFIWGLGSVLEGDFVLLYHLGGNTEGSVGFLTTTDPNTGLTKNLTNIPLQATLNGNPANSNATYTPNEISAIAAGIPLADAYQFQLFNEAFAIETNQFVATRSLFSFNQQIAALLGNAYDDYQQGLLEEVKRYYAANNLVLGDAQALKSFQQYLDQQLQNRYQLAPIGAAYCQ